ncbi:MAG: AAA family ATPase [Acidimicrobiaceae bacterium]|nr:AAA family ATPase [Acidimicrobiaceae bacterium]
MRFHRVRLWNYRGVDNCEVAFFTEGVTVIEGPNEVGKTSIPEGIDLLFDLMDSSKSRRVRSVKPVGRDEGPEVEVEVSSGRYRFLYRKRWLRRSMTTLKIISPQHEQLSGRAAHERVKEILAETLDSALWKALRVEQGTELVIPKFDVPSLGRALDRAAGGASSTEQHDDLWSLICDERERHWTLTGRPKGKRTAQQQAVEQARMRVSELAQQLDRMEDDVSEMNRLAVEAQQLETTQDRCERRERELSGQWESVQRLNQKVDRLSADHSTALEKQSRLTAEWKSRRDAARTVEERQGQLAALESEARQAAPILAAATERAAAVEAGLDKARTALRIAESEQRRADDDRDHHRRCIEVQQLTERYNRVVEAEKTLEEAENRLAFAKVDEELVVKIEQAHLAVVRAEAAVASVETTAKRELSMRVDGEDVILGEGETQHTTVEDEVVLTIPDVAQLRVRAGTGSKSLAVERRKARDDLRRLCDTAAVADLTEARAAAEQRKEVQRARDEALETIERDLRDLTVDVLRSKAEGLSRRITSYEAERPQDSPLPPDFEAAKRIAADNNRVVGDLQAEFKSLERVAESAADVLDGERINESNLSGRIKIAQDAKTQAVNFLEAARKQRSDDEITTDLATAERHVETTGESLEKAEKNLRAADPESLASRLSNAREAAQRTHEDLQSNRDRGNVLRGRLAVESEKGLHTRRDEEASRLRHLEREHQRSEAKAQAAALLYNIFARCRQKARLHYVVPFKRKIEQFGRIVFNASFTVDIDDDLRVMRRTLDGDTLRVDQLSTGAQEQLGVISRLACAAIVSPDGGGAPVIIDDALGWSDPSRLERMGAAIAAAGGQCQTIILTCTPGRYAHIGKATTIRLPSRA